MLLAIGHVGRACAAPQPRGRPSRRISTSTDIASAIRVVCQHLGRPIPEEVVQALQNEWYSTAGDLVALSDETARSLGVPLRLKSAITELLSSSSTAAPAPTSAAQPLEAAAAAAAAAASQLLGSTDAHRGHEDSPAAVSEQTVGGRESQLGDNGSSLAAALGPSSGSAAGKGRQETDWSVLPIEERRAPKKSRFDHKMADLPRLSQRRRNERYALSAAEISPALQAEFDAFHRFCTVRHFGAQAEPIAAVTAAKYADHMRAMLGYMHRHLGVPLDQLSFSSALPSSGREGVSVAFDYILWLHSERNIAVQTEGLVVRSLAAAAKFLFHSESKVKPTRGESPYSDLGIVKELRSMSNAAKKQAAVAPRTSDEEQKWLDWPQFLEVCAELRLECAALDERGRKRSPVAIACSLQRYLIFSILSCVPDRQRTLRELEVGRTLVRDREQRWIIKHSADDYKTGRSYGERPPLTIATHIYGELEAYISKWRAFLEPRHNYLFSQPNGEPFTDKSLYKLFWTSCYRLTGKRTNPHLVRDSIVTFLRGGGATERELEALAIYMGHSVEMQRNTYDRRTKEQKVEPAVELLASLNRRALAAGSRTRSSEQ
ncbi:hypothetical protein D9Q98_000380 [Chlorella vulgaris]|uniref:Uncharacterized protein n=1 Tax=Chlorella vulgaris TaxID=3077 RepID=A0A9D4Z245_CHLVU|nr:hypothetical protein D9Q98_000380 [Chlorella vulgaris]